MSNNVGIWIDHRKAIIVFLSESNHETRVIESNVEEQVGTTGSAQPSKPYGSKHFVASNRHEKKFYQYLNSYYDDVVSNLKTADQILLVGPGEAKIEFQKRIESKEMQNRIVAVEPADKMTQPQFIAKVKKFFDQC